MTASLPAHELRNRPGSLAASIPLLEDFRFTHEPIGANGQSRFVGRDAELQRLSERIIFSDGGSFLIAGYRGVGKTSFVNRVIRRLRELAATQRQLVGVMDVVDVHLMLARPMEAVELMHHIVRQLRERLIELDVFERLPFELQRDIELAYQRTSMSVSLKRATKVGSEGALSELGLSVAGVGVKLLRKKTTELTSGSEWSYLAYDDRAAESDVMRIAEQIAAGYAPPLSWPRRMLQTLRGDRSPKVPLKIIFVFDELDKIDEDASRGADGQPFLDRLLGHLKNLFTTSHISFIFVAGKDLYDRWLLDVGRGDSVYESVFCYDRYIPCMWADVEEVCRSVIPIQGLEGEQRTSCDEFIAFLKYKGRGIPRKLLREFHYYVELRGSRLQLSFNRDDQRRFRFYSELQNAIDEAAMEMFGVAGSDSSAIDYDKKRLAAYYLIDWVLTHGVSEFAEEQAVARSRELSVKIAPAEELAASAVSSIMRMLMKYEFVEEVNRQSGDKTILPELEARGRTRYRLTARRRAELNHFAAVFEDEKGAVTPPPPQTDLRFRILEQIGEGGMSLVYRAWDDTLQRVVALKVLSDELVGERTAQLRFLREAKILELLDHPNIVHFYGTAEYRDSVAFAMELIEGVSLLHLIGIHPNLPPPFVIATADGMARALQHVHERGISRIDLKSSNILVRRDGQPMLTDFGIARPADADVGGRLTKSGFILGTPHYMAPEQIREARDADARADLYSFGAVLFEMLTGELPFNSHSLVKLIDAIYTQAPRRVSEIVDVPPQLDELVHRCLSKLPDDRPSTAEILETLANIELEPFEAGIFVAQCMAKKAEVDQAKDQITSETPIPLAKAVESNGPPTLTWTAQPNGPATMADRLPLEPAHADAYLEITGPETVAGRSQPLADGRCRIGRDEMVELQIIDTSLSRHHTDIIGRDGRFFVHDLNSANGTFVNGESVREDRELADGDIIRLGHVVMVFKMKR
jgi:serine/threonine-protein kinase